MHKAPEFPTRESKGSELNVNSVGKRQLHILCCYHISKVWALQLQIRRFSYTRKRMTTGAGPDLTSYGNI